MTSVSVSSLASLYHFATLDGFPLEMSRTHLSHLSPAFSHFHVCAKIVKIAKIGKIVKIAKIAIQSDQLFCADKLRKEAFANQVEKSTMTFPHLLSYIKCEPENQT